MQLNFSEIISGSNSVQYGDRFSQNYKPKRRIITNIETNNNEEAFQDQNSQGKKSKVSLYKLEKKEESELQDLQMEESEDWFLEGNFRYESPEKNTDYQEGESYEARPSSQRDESGRLDRVTVGNDHIPEVHTSEEENSIMNSQAIRETNEEIKEAFQHIEYEYVDQSIRQRKWINRSIMEKRDQDRMEDYRRKQAHNSLKREFKEMQEVRSHNKVHTNKKSRELAKKALKKKIKGVIDQYSQNGYMAFEHYLHVLYILQITQSMGKLDMDSPKTSVLKRVKEEKEQNELNFALQLWNKINCYLFNYVD